MSKDVVADWKTKKFAISNRALNYGSGNIIVLTDLKFWAEHIDELREWCKINGGKHSGMIVHLDSEEQLTMFVLRWS